jgi:hypothetical protein
MASCHPSERARYRIDRHQSAQQAAAGVGVSAVPCHADSLVLPAVAAYTTRDVRGVSTVLEVVATGCC